MASQLLPTLLLLALLVPVPLAAFLYQPATGGQIWDPSVTWWRGRYYAHAMYQHPGDRTNVYTSGWLAESDDGCHWVDGGAVAPEAKGDMWFKGFVRQIRGVPQLGLQAPPPPRGRPLAQLLAALQVAMGKKRSPRAPFFPPFSHAGEAAVKDDDALFIMDHVRAPEHRAAIVLCCMLLYKLCPGREHII